MSRLSELSGTVVSASVFTQNGASVSFISSGNSTAAAAQNYVQVGSVQTFPTSSNPTASFASFPDDNTMFATAHYSGSSYTVSLQVYYDTQPPSNTFTLGATIPCPFLTPGTIKLVTAVNSKGGVVAVVGNPNDNSIDDDNGSFCIFTRPSSTSMAWTLVQATRAGTAQLLGQDVAVSADGSVIAVGAPATNAFEGAVLVYEYSAEFSSYLNVAELVGTGAVGAAGQGFAVQISSDGKTIVSGGPADGVQSGALWTFRNVNGTWSQVGVKVVPAALIPAGAHFGSSLALSADAKTLAVAAAANTLVLNTGCVVLFTFVNGAWKEGETVYPLAASGNTETPLLNPVKLNQNGDVLCFGVGNNNGTQGGTFIYNLSRTTGLWVGNGVARIGTGASISVPGGVTQTCAAFSPDGSRLLIMTVNSRDNVTDPAYFWIFI